MSVDVYSGHEVVVMNLLDKLKFWEKGIQPIGVDLSEDAIILAQLQRCEQGIHLYASGSENKPAHITTGTCEWQKWAIEAIKSILAKNKFNGKDVIAAMPSNDLYIESIKLPKTNGNDPLEEVLAKIQPRLPFDSNDSIIKHIPADENNILVMASDRKRIERYLAIFEKTNLKLKSICVWPLALTCTYAKFFGRRKTDIDATVMLLATYPNQTNVVICRYKSLLFAYSIAIGLKQLSDENNISRLVLDLNSLKRNFNAIYKKAKFDRVIFLSCKEEEKDIYIKIAKELQLSAQMGNCLAANIIENIFESGIDRRLPQPNWSVAFGLSLSEEA